MVEASFFCRRTRGGENLYKSQIPKPIPVCTSFSRRHDYVTFLCVLKCVDAQKASSFKAFCYLEADAKRQDETRELKKI